MTSLPFSGSIWLQFCVLRKWVRSNLQGCMDGGYNGNINFQIVKALYSTIKDRLPLHNYLCPMEMFTLKGTFNSGSYGLHLYLLSRHNHARSRQFMTGDLRCRFTLRNSKSLALSPKVHYKHCPHCINV
jgi:hypothetical protein